MCVCVCVCVCERERERERESGARETGVNSLNPSVYMCNCMIYYCVILLLRSLIKIQPARGERRKAKNRQLRDSNPGCLTVAAITTEPRSHHRNQPPQFSFHTAPVVLPTAVSHRRDHTAVWI